MQPAQDSTVSLRQLRRENDEAVYPALFEIALDGIASGNPMTAVVESYPLRVNIDRFRAWVLRDETRRARYYEAQALGAEVVAEQIIEIADADDSIEDVARSTLRINSRKWLMGVWNRKRFGDVKQIEQNVVIDMGEAMAAAQARVDAARTVDAAVRLIDRA